MVTRDSVWEVPDPLSLHISEPEDTWCRVDNLGLADWRSGIRGQRKSTKARKRGWNQGERNLGSKDIGWCCFSAGLFHYSYCYKQGNGYGESPPTPRTTPKSCFTLAEYVGKDLWSLACWTRTWCIYLYIFFKQEVKLLFWGSWVQSRVSAWNQVCYLIYTSLVKCLDGMICFSFSFLASSVLD